MTRRFLPYPNYYITNLTRKEQKVNICDELRLLQGRPSGPQLALQPPSDRLTCTMLLQRHEFVGGLALKILTSCRQGMSVRILDGDAAWA